MASRLETIALALQTSLNGETFTPAATCGYRTAPIDEMEEMQCVFYLRPLSHQRVPITRGTTQHIYGVELTFKERVARTQHHPNQQDPDESDVTEQLNLVDQFHDHIQKQKTMSDAYFVSIGPLEGDEEFSEDNLQDSSLFSHQKLITYQEILTN